MKFLMLVRKELRETLPWLLLAGLALLGVGAFLLRAEMQFDRTHWAYSRLSPGTTVATPRLLSYYSALSGTAHMEMLLVSLGTLPERPWPSFSASVASLLME